MKMTVIDAVTGKKSKAIDPDYTPPSLDQRKAAARQARDRELVLTDKTQLPDFRISDSKRAEWVKYRDALRDIPEQDGFPDNIEWPRRPKGKI